MPRSEVNPSLSDYFRTLLSLIRLLCAIISGFVPIPLTTFSKKIALTGYRSTGAPWSSDIQGSTCGRTPSSQSLSALAIVRLGSPLHEMKTFIRGGYR